MRELYRSENVVVRAVPQANLSRWIVTFDNYGIGHGFDRQGFGEDFLIREGISAIHVMGCREDWYQYPDMPAALEAVRLEVAGARRVLTYGSSMGAYAAIRFADRAGATAALALSPQYSIDPAKVPFEKRWSQDSYQIRWLDDLDGPIRSEIQPVIVYDPTTQDRLHVDLIRADTPVTEIRIPYTGHPVTTFLTDAKLLRRLVHVALRGTVDAPRFERTCRRRSHRTATWLSNFADRQPASRLRTGIALARKAVALAPGSAPAMVSLAKRLTIAGEHEEAIALHAEVARLTDRADFLWAWAEALLSAGHTADARTLAREVVEGAPDRAHLHSWEARFLWADGADREAMEALDRAIALDPSNEFYRSSQRKYRGLRQQLWIERKLKGIRP